MRIPPPASTHVSPAPSAAKRSAMLWSDGGLSALESAWLFNAERSFGEVTGRFPDPVLVIWNSGEHADVCAWSEGAVLDAVGSLLETINEPETVKSTTNDFEPGPSQLDDAALYLDAFAAIGSGIPRRISAEQAMSLFLPAEVVLKFPVILCIPSDVYIRANAEKAAAALSRALYPGGTRIAKAAAREFGTRLLQGGAMACRELWMTSAWTDMLLLPDPQARQELQEVFCSKFEGSCGMWGLQFVSHFLRQEIDHWGCTSGP